MVYILMFINVNHTLTLYVYYMLKLGNHVFLLYLGRIMYNTEVVTTTDILSLVYIHCCSDLCDGKFTVQLVGSLAKLPYNAYVLQPQAFRVMNL